MGSGRIGLVWVCRVRVLRNSSLLGIALEEAHISSRCRPRRCRFQTLAYNYMADVLGIASEEAYPYKGVSDYCHSDIPHAAKFANVRRTTSVTLHRLPCTSAVTSFRQRSARMCCDNWHAGVSPHRHPFHALVCAPARC